MPAMAASALPAIALSRASPLLQRWLRGAASHERQQLARCDDDMTSLRFDDGGCAAMTPVACEAFRHYCCRLVVSSFIDVF